MLSVQCVDNLLSRTSRCSRSAPDGASRLETLRVSHAPAFEDPRSSHAPALASRRTFRQSLPEGQSRLLRHLHQEDRPDLVLPGRRHPEHRRDLGGRRARSGVKGTLPPSLSTRARLLVIYHLFSSLSYDTFPSSPQRPDPLQGSRRLRAHGSSPRPPP